MIKNPGLPANLPQQTYIFPSCIFINGDQTQSCTDGLLNGGNGLCSPVSLPKRGGVHLYKFNAIIGPASSITEGGISNQGNLTQGTLGPVLPFSATEAIHFRPSITIEKTVHRGVLTSCSNGNETISGRQGDNVTYCFQVTNTGNSYLNNVVVTDPDNGMQPITTIPFMAPGDVHFVSFQTRMPALPIKTNATVTAEPRLVNKNVIPTHEGGPVTDSDDAGVSPIPFVPAIDVKKYAGPPGSTCNIPRMQDSMYVSADTQFEYCYAVRTLGDECLVNINLTDNSVGGIGRRSISRLCPTDTPFFFSGPLSRTTVDIPLTDAIVAGIGEISRTNVTDTDPAGVDVPTFIPKLSIKKYAGPQGSNCKISSMKDTTYPAPNTKFQYCYVLKNIGNECVSNITISDSAVGGIGTQSVALLCPTDSALNISGPLASTLIDIASTNAVATGKGVYSGSTVSAKDPAAVDVPAFAPKLKLKKYAGPVGSSCGVSAMQDDNFVTTDTKFEYCYIISNPSNECVTNITLSDNAVGGIVSQQIGSLCPSEVPKTIVGPPSMTEGKVPSLDGTVQGLGEYTKIAVTSSDPAAVEYVKPTVPGIKIDKTVHLGEIGTCVTGQELEYGFAGTVISYCYEVTNTGDVDLSVLLTDAPVHTSETFPLAVGQSTFIKKVSTIAADLTSPGVAFGTPTSGVAVTASDPASVKLVAQNTRCE